MQDEPDRMRAAYKKALSSLTAIAFPTAIGLAVLAEPVTRFVLSEKWLPIIPLLQLMCVISLFKTMEKVVPIAMATGNTRALFGRDLRTLFIRMPLLLAGIFLGQHLGWGILIGALLGRGTAAMINTIWNMQLIAKITPITIVDHLKAFWRPLLASAIMAIAVHNLRYLPLFDSLHIASRIFIWSSAGALIYALVLGITWVLCKRPDGLENTLLELTKSLPARFAARRSSLTDEGK
jgi:O-antigen/teichoic acid export membrane protein